MLNALGTNRIHVWGVLISLTLAPQVLWAQEEASDRVWVRNLDFDGNRAIDDLTLQMSIATSEAAWVARFWLTRAPAKWLGLGRRPAFDGLEFRRDVFRLLLLYRRSGYAEATVDTLINHGDGFVDIAFLIDEGEPIRVSSIEIDGGDAVIPGDRLLRSMPLRVGDPFDRNLMLAVGDSIEYEFKNLGYPFVEVFRNFRVNTEDREAWIRYVVQPGRRAHVGDVEVVGPPGVDEELVRGVLEVAPGDLFSQRALYASQRELYRLGMFNFADVRLSDSLPDSPDDSLVTVRAQVAEGAAQVVRTGFGYGTYDCFRVAGSWTLGNFLGGGRSLELSSRLAKIGTGAPFDGNFESKGVCGGLKADEGTRRLELNYDLRAGLRLPRFLGRSRDVGISFSAEKFSEFQTYVRDAVGFDISMTQRTAWRMPITLTYSVSYGKTVADFAIFCAVLNVCRQDDVAIFEAPRWKSTAGITIVRDRSNSPVNPTRGTVLTVEGKIASRLVGSDAQIEFAKGVAEFRSYHPVGRRGVFAWRARWGSIRSPDVQFQPQEIQFIPVEERFYGGGASTVRGFRQNEVGPLVYVRELESMDVPTDSISREDLFVSPIGGNHVVFFNAEYRFPINRAGRIRAAIFVDAGRVVDRNADRPDYGMRITPGAGLRFATPLGPMRFDVAYNGHGLVEGNLFDRVCPVPNDISSCNQEPSSVFPTYRPPAGGRGLFGISALGYLRLNISIGQAF